MKTLTLALGALAAMMSTAAVEAADIKVLASNGVRGTLEELAPAFERATGNKLAITFDLAAKEGASGTYFASVVEKTAGAVFKSRGQEPG